MLVGLDDDVASPSRRRAAGGRAGPGPPAGSGPQVGICAEASTRDSDTDPVSAVGGSVEAERDLDGCVLLAEEQRVRPAGREQRHVGLDVQARPRRAAGTTATRTPRPTWTTGRESSSTTDTATGVVLEHRQPGPAPVVARGLGAAEQVVGGLQERFALIVVGQHRLQVAGGVGEPVRSAGLPSASSRPEGGAQAGEVAEVGGHRGSLAAPPAGGRLAVERVPRLGDRWRSPASRRSSGWGSAPAPSTSAPAAALSAAAVSSSACQARATSASAQRSTTTAGPARTRGAPASRPVGRSSVPTTRSISTLARGVACPPAAGRRRRRRSTVTSPRPWSAGRCRGGRGASRRRRSRRRRRAAGRWAGARAGGRGAPGGGPHQHRGPLGVNRQRLDRGPGSTGPRGAGRDSSCGGTPGAGGTRQPAQGPRLPLPARARCPVIVRAPCPDDDHRATTT